MTRRTLVVQATLGVVMMTTSLFAQDVPANVRAWNGRVLQFQAALKAAAPAQAAQIRNDAAPAFGQRAAALEALIRRDPAAALGLAFSEELRNELASDFPAAAASLEERGVWSGRSDHLVFDDPARQVRRYQVRIDAGSASVEVYSAGGEPHCVSGDTLRVEGVRVNNVVAAGSTSVQPGVAAAGGCQTVGQQNSAVLLVQFPGVPLPTSVTPAGVWDIFFSPSGRSVNTYWQESSYGQASAAGNVFGPYVLDRVYSCDEYNLMRAAAIAAADADANFQNYSRVFIVFPNPGTCSWAGLGTLGCSSLSSADGAFTASTSWLLASYMGSRDNGVKLSTHEGGHNLTLHHASSRDFGTETLGPVGAAGTLSEYGDPNSTMGSWNFGQYAAPHKARMGWLTASDVVTTESNGSFLIAPFESSSLSVQAVKVRRGTGNNAWMWVEYRQPQGVFDSTLNAQLFTGGLIHYEDSTTGARTHLLDFTKGTSSYADAALAGSWTDPYSNVTISTSGASASGLSLNVSYGAVPCARVQPTVSLSPPNPSVHSGSSASYTVTVTNNDTTGCAASSFDLTASLPAGWVASLSATVLTLNPTVSGSVTMTAAVPTGWTPGTHPVSVTAADPNHAATGAANCTVTAPPEPITTTSISVSPSSVAVRRTVTIQTTVSRASGAVAGAAVTFTVTRPNGSRSTATVTTGPSGLASWAYKTQARGTHTVAATASAGGATTTAGPATFTVY